MQPASRHQHAAHYTEDAEALEGANHMECLQMQNSRDPSGLDAAVPGGLTMPGMWLQHVTCSAR